MPIEIRLATTEDAAGVAEIYRPVVRSTPTSLELEPPDAAEMARRVAATLPAYPWLVCARRGRVLGYAYGSQHRARPAYRWSVETSVYVHADAGRQGLGRGLYTALFAILSAQGFHNAYAGITLPNPASVALHASMGFEPIGVFREVGFKQGAWHDVGWWQRPLGSPATDPAAPLALEALLDGPAWRQALKAGLHLIHPDA